jgi:AmmeMemoRadiSam system protein A
MPLSESDRRGLVSIAAGSIRHGLQHGSPLLPDLALLPAPLLEQGASFVTLTAGGRLRGCIGTLQARRPLAEDVAGNAFESAFHDPRFPPVTENEAPGLLIEISILSPPEPFPCDGEADLLAKLRPGEDGLVIEDGLRRATFLPSVWEHLPRPRDFLDQLMLKAGLPRGHWSPTLKLFRYGAEKVGGGFPAD